MANFMVGQKLSTPSLISSTTAPVSVPLKALAGTAAMLLIALRGIPLQVGFCVLSFLCFCFLADVLN